MDNVLTNLATELATLLAKNTYAAVTDKLRIIKTSLNKDEQIQEYRNLIDELQEEKTNLGRIANSYKQALERVAISDADITSLHNTIKKAIKTIQDFSGSQNLDDKTVNTFLDLLNSDTLKSLQLLGYNYKEAIGKPLTKMTAAFIGNTLTTKKS
ncbi:hypothetical protein ATW97_07250 [Oenococcus oeni]|nr:hypothetical protein [Oenococcus oeni]KEP87146.1 hypothetical protein X279_07460 [Oenococcus oeni IOEB_0501]OIL34702.1 hypothetical protein ATX10_07520 [Oenococcus oeni]OIM35083.1 hypothetical protein ATX70_07415 [Oenococcus oeni]OIM57971.1 hypothetical protein ATX85_10280 [Oenococcus oeni]OIM58124.1 hypothetical protein ATX85_09540 [Oenococcus oeni]